MSRGCPEKCRYCWATFGMGKFRWHPTEYILASLERARAVTDQLGFVATAVGDHPDIERILREANGARLPHLGLVDPHPGGHRGGARALHASGDRSITLAPETGTDELRVKMGKPITNAFLLEKIRLISARLHPAQALLHRRPARARRWRTCTASSTSAPGRGRSCWEQAPKSGVIGNIHLGVNVLVPKPYTPWQREPMDDEREPEGEDRLLQEGRGADAERLDGLGLDPPGGLADLHQQGRQRRGRALERRPAASTCPRSCAASPTASTPRSSAPGDLRWHFMRQG